eukprot:TRINITY_DN24409_c0_g1_i1.p1 TRINITY_DN24409_c0_g1~~TRINITY_DN24409_c0_g1_i1.p1  ORF type:complete len:146 (-),score=2.24 TRINITY_DN24409_c0_g1_i1:164-601(-)
MLCMNLPDNLQSLFRFPSSNASDDIAVTSSSVHVQSYTMLPYASGTMTCALLCLTHNPINNVDAASQCLPPRCGEENVSTVLPCEGTLAGEQQIFADSDLRKTGLRLRVALSLDTDIKPACQEAIQIRATPDSSQSSPAACNPDN